MRFEDTDKAEALSWIGENGQHIAKKQKIVLQAWNELQDNAADKKAALVSSNDTTPSWTW